MVKLKSLIFILLIIIFLSFSFYPTVYEISHKDKLVDQSREFILEHNFYWPDFNLYLSKIRQGFEGRWTGLERYTSEPHQGSLIQEFYVILGQIGRLFKIDPNSAYQLGRLILSPLLLILIYRYCKYFFPQFSLTLIAFLIVVISGSFPRFYTEEGIYRIGRYMEWWSNIDALQRITFIPHILFGQIVSFYVLYQLTMNHNSPSPPLTLRGGWGGLRHNKFLLYILLGNLAGLVFPPSLITLDGVILLNIAITALIKLKYQILNIKYQKYIFNIKNIFNFLSVYFIFDFLFLIFTLPSLLYFMILTRKIPWSALVEAHRLHPMMIPLDQYVLGTGPILLLGFGGAMVSIIKQDKKYQPLIFWVLSTFLFASFFSIVRDQSPLRFTQTGLFIPLGLLGTFFLQQIWIALNHLGGGRLIPLSGRSHDSYEVKESKSNQIITLGLKKFLVICYMLFVICYVLENLFIMKTSYDWQISKLRVGSGEIIPIDN